MYRVLLVVLLITLSQQDSGSDYFLSPSLPPTAFIGQYYTTQFRVLGLDNPVFKFSNLPTELKGYSDGTLAGTPLNAGSYPVRVAFTTANCNSYQDIVVRIASSISSTEQFNRSAGVMSSEKFIVVNNQQRSFTYKSGDQVNLALQAAQGVSPYTWSYMNLPTGLVGSNDGKVTGSLSDAGYYSFSASANDAKGQTADCYYTFNIQPQNVSVSNLIQVPNMNVPVQYDINQVEKQQLQATNAVFSAITVVNNAKNISASAQDLYAKTTLALNMATAQEAAAAAKVTQASANRQNADNAEAKAHDVLEAANKIVDLATTNVNNMRKNVATASSNLDTAQQKFNLANKAFEEANNVYINAQAMSSQAAQNAKAALTAALNAQNVYDLAFNTYKIAKQTLSDALNQKQQADLIVNAARNALNLATQVNDASQSDLTIAQDTYNKSYSALDNANALVSSLRGSLQDATNTLGASKFNLQQANNNLIVAQAVKEQADKATAIVKTQSSTLPAVNSTSTYIFAGCNQLNYPTVAGADIVGSHNSLGFQLKSGYTMLYGNCTTSSKVVVGDGDVINYSGYLKDGYVHATSYNKWQ